MAHLLDALERRCARKSDHALVHGRGDVADAQSRIIVARADDAVEVDLDKRHAQRATARKVSPVFSPSSSPVAPSTVALSPSLVATWPKPAAKSASRPAATSIFSPSGSSVVPASFSSRASLMVRILSVAADMV